MFSGLMWMTVIRGACFDRSGRASAISDWISLFGYVSRTCASLSAIR